MKLITGDLLDTDVQVICHVCNCQHTMGAGLAQQIKLKYPEAYEADLKTKKGDQAKLGTISYATAKNGKIIVNLYAQYNYGKGRQLNYEALYRCLMTVHKEFRGKTIAFPHGMGCGMAGGSWRIVFAMIKSVFAFMASEKITIVEYEE